MLFYSAVIFLLQSLAPAFQGVMAKPVNGYTDTLCIMRAQETIFVKIEDDQLQDRSACYECPTCIIQANLSAEPVSYDPWLEIRYRAESGIASGLVYRVASLPLFPSFLSRAPPA